MRPKTHKISYYRQTTSVNCSQTALAMLLSYYGKQMTVTEVMKTVPRAKDESGGELGSNLIQELGIWCLGQAFQADLYTFDAAVIDLCWKSLTNKQLVQALEQASGKRTLATLGEYSSKHYVKTYADFVVGGGKLHILPAPDVKLLYGLLQKGPFIAAVSYNALHGEGGTITTHAVVVYGLSKSNKFLIADPQAGRVTITPERLIAAIMAAQIEADNMILKIKK